ncbi:MAG: phosphate ABC transporter ATP-binding protein [Pseudomonas sp.]
MAPAESPSYLATERLTALYHRQAAVKDVTVTLPRHSVTAIIGPSGCGKSTFLRCLNRMHELSDGGWVTGKVLLDGADIYGGGVDPVRVRRRVGMVFQRPTPFPTMSIHQNVAAGLRANGRLSGRALDAAVEQALRRAALWEEVKDRLPTSALALSGGQQQRLCMARALAPEPEVLLLDEPTASLDEATERQLIHNLDRWAAHRTLIIATHRMSVLSLVNRVIVVDNGQIIVDDSKANAIARLSKPKGKTQ